jgi:hypothetical protein
MTLRYLQYPVVALVLMVSGACANAEYISYLVSECATYTEGLVSRDRFREGLSRAALIFAAVGYVTGRNTERAEQKRPQLEQPETGKELGERLMAYCSKHPEKGLDEVLNMLYSDLLRDQ